MCLGFSGDSKVYLLGQVRRGQKLLRLQVQTMEIPIGYWLARLRDGAIGKKEVDSCLRSISTIQYNCVLLDSLRLSAAVLR